MILFFNSGPTKSVSTEHKCFIDVSVVPAIVLMVVVVAVVAAIVVVVVLVVVVVAAIDNRVIPLGIDLIFVPKHSSRGISFRINRRRKSHYYNILFQTFSRFRYLS